MQAQTQDPIFAVLGLHNVMNASMPPPPPATPAPILQPDALMSTALTCPAYNAWHAANWYACADVASHTAAINASLGLYNHSACLAAEKEELTASADEEGPLLLPDVLPVEQRPSLAVPPLPVESASSSPTTPFGLEPIDATPAESTHVCSLQELSAPPSWKAREASGDDATATPSASASLPDGDASDGSIPPSSRRESPIELNLAERFEEALTQESSPSKSKTPSGFRADAPVFVPRPAVPVMSSWTCLATNPHPQAPISPVATGFLAAGLGLSDAARTGTTPKACGRWSPESFLESRSMMLRCRMKVLAEAQGQSLDVPSNLRTIAIEELRSGSDCGNSGDSYATTDEEEEVVLGGKDPVGGKSGGKGKSESRSKIRGSAAAARARYAAVGVHTAGHEHPSKIAVGTWRPLHGRNGASA